MICLRQSQKIKKIDIKAKITGFFLILIFLFTPDLIAILIYIFLITPFYSNGFSIELSIISSIIGSCFTATFFYVALPRIGILKKIDQRGYSLHFALVILLPAFLGLISYIFLICSNPQGLPDLKVSLFLKISNALLCCSLLSFIWSCLIILFIVSPAFKYKNQ